MGRPSTQARLTALADAFTDLGPAWGRWVTVCTPPEAVSYIRLRLLRALDQHGDCTMTHLASALNVTQRRITSLAAALADEQFVERRPNPDDGRSTVISITDLGRKHLERNWAQFQAEVREAFGDLPPELRKQLLDITPKLTEALRARTAAKAVD
ncbi:MarR family winged helix-turn-helix transcriptional regulator [Amycolatopsis sp. NPDC051372]|uniref:MarR family winged helix-turn-helix transcriptional regulator n=1 Tax=Amycolatopsis sp. NPDC051372 TaxID=3155669 RepID=UPI003423712E